VIFPPEGTQTITADPPGGNCILPESEIFFSTKLAETPDLSALYFRKNLIIHNQPLIRYFLRFDRTNSLL